MAENTFNNVFTEEDDLDYVIYKVKDGETFNFDSIALTLDGFNRNPSHKNYKPEEGDIAISANLTLDNGKDSAAILHPLYVIQNLQPFSIKDYDPQTGIHVRFNQINPENGEMTFMVARDKRQGQDIEMFIADDVPRSDILIVQADIFPGINLVWVGSLMMLFGLLLSLIVRLRKT